ncbi:MAG: MarR family transcriptional regulator [Alphaproteobacteria bacterium]|nr:MarR family transcriptional regulator [Alphaproteobacteria bacterium]MBN9592245.1 MarR family transcriptional regulator [Alphaproteobacteria bacterium]
MTTEPFDRTAFYRMDNFVAGNSVGYLLKTASNLLQPALESAFAGSDLTVVQWKVLMYLRDEIASTCKEISHDLPYDPGSLTRVVDELERKGYLKRDRNAADRRVVSLILTDAGRDAVQAAIPRVIAVVNAALSGFSEDEAQTLVDLLVRFIAGLRTMRKDGLPLPPVEA